MGKLNSTFLFLALFPGASTNAVAATDILSQEAVSAAVGSAFQDILGGRPAQAVAKVEPVIASFDAMQAGNPHACAQTEDQAATLALLDAAKGDRKLTIVSLDYCAGYFIKGFALIDLHRARDALPWLQSAHDHAPLHAHFTNELAEWYKADRQWQKAYDLFREASDSADNAEETSRDPYKARALRGMGYTRIETGDLNEAEALFNASLKLEPGSKAALNELEYIRSLRRTPTT